MKPLFIAKQPTVLTFDYLPAAVCLCLSTKGKQRLTLENSEATLNDARLRYKSA